MTPRNEAESRGPAPSLPPPAALMALAETAPHDACDVVVIGGGINGTGVARDLALRGLKVTLFERNDLAFGASGNSTGMIHGGPRYLLNDPNVTKSSCEDSGYIQQIAPHLLFRIPFIMPIKAGIRGKIEFELVDAFFRAYDDYQPLKRGKMHTRLTPSEMARLEPGIVGSMVGGVTFDEWGVDGARLCVINAIDAKERGAAIYTHTAVETIARAPESAAEDPPVALGAHVGSYVVTARDLHTQRVVRVRARVVVNATGAWGPITAALGNLPAARVKVRGGKGIHIIFDRRVSNYGLVTEAIDGRQILMLPWENMTVLGTTDDDYFGDLNDVHATSDEVRYLIQGASRVFPTIREARAIGTFAGVRPTIYEYGKLEDQLSREHAVIDHAKDGAPGVFSMIGGKLASYRQFAQEMSDTIAHDLAPETSCTTHLKPLPGGDRVPDALTIAEQHHLVPVAARRLVYRHGSRAARILQRMQKKPRERAIVCACEPVLEAEVRHAVSAEMARTIDDVARRTRLGLGACGGMRCAVRCGQIVADELGLPAKAGIAQARDFIERCAKSRIVAMGPEQARQEALAIAQMRATLGTKEKA